MGIYVYLFHCGNTVTLHELWLYLKFQISVCLRYLIYYWSQWSENLTGCWVCESLNCTELYEIVDNDTIEDGYDMPRNMEKINKAAIV